MIVSLITSLSRITIFWYVLGLLVLFIGNPDWAQSRYARLMHYPGIPQIELTGITTAWSVQWHLLLYWTVPVLVLWVLAFLIGLAVTEVRVRLALRHQGHVIQARGAFWGVHVPAWSLGDLPRATTPRLEGPPVVFASEGQAPTGATWIDVRGPIADVLEMLSPEERQLATELIQVLCVNPEHFAGLGHGVGLLEHTLNVAGEAADRCTREFRLPFIAALAHDIGKLVTFRQDENGEWVRRGLHSRESARIIATLPGFEALPELHQRALMLAIKYDHAPNTMPAVRGEREASTLAMRIINALSHADRTATAAEKDRNLEKLKPEDLLWKDFVDFLRDAPVVQRGKKGVVNQVNNPPDSPYLFIYEAPWRDAAVRRLPPEVAAALDLTRRDAGKVAKYTRILAERLKKDGLLLVEMDGKQVSDSNPLWDIQSGTGEKAPVMRGILVLHAEPLWRAMNYRLSTKSPFPVQILAPNADADGHVNQAPEKRDAPPTPDVSDGMKLDTSSESMLAAVGLSGTESSGAAPARRRARSGFKDEKPSAQQDLLIGLTPAAPKPVAKPAPAMSAARVVDAPPTAKAVAQAAEPAVEAPAVVSEQIEPAALARLDQSVESISDVASTGAPVSDDLIDAEMQAAMEAAMAQQGEGPDSIEDTVSSTASMDSALSLLASLGALDAAADEHPQPETEPESLPESQPESQPELQPTIVPDDLPQPAPAANAAAPEAPPSNGVVPDPAALSMTERRAGIAIADASAVTTWPHLKAGDKYYGTDARDVKEGLRQAGSLYAAVPAASSTAVEPEASSTATQRPTVRPAHTTPPRGTETPGLGNSPRRARRKIT